MKRLRGNNHEIDQFWKVKHNTKINERVLQVGRLGAGIQVHNITCTDMQENT